MTEEEAKTKWCPFARLIPAKRLAHGSIQTNGDAPTFNRYNTDEKAVAALPSGGFCIGSACMAWRGIDEPFCVPWTNSINEFRGQPTGHGYCGLAGKP